MKERIVHTTGHQRRKNSLEASLGLALQRNPGHPFLIISGDYPVKEPVNYE
jgi:hypothetical protein